MTHVCAIVFLRLLAPMALALAAILPLTGGAEETGADPGPTVIVVRHAEKIDDSRDPALSEAGAERAEALAETLEHAGLDAAYASQYQRTRLTAMPAARAAGLPVRVEPIEGDVDAWTQGFSAELARDHRCETVLVVGHSNTVPPLVAALCGCQVEPLTDSDYDRIYIVNGARSRTPDLIVARYGKASGQSD
ncbi:MAG TPA: phosphoglycerate mutase family protein [Wenzhouxiangellaceae bacterium]|nr:phosphoglycerate mutase family protein [Wenzhouxiangellaceae bacterium]